jgi:hypothetical protein
VEPRQRKKLNASRARSFSVQEGRMEEFVPFIGSQLAHPRSPRAAEIVHRLIGEAEETLWVTPWSVGRSGFDADLLDQDRQRRANSAASRTVELLRGEAVKTRNEILVTERILTE